MMLNVTEKNSWYFHLQNSPSKITFKIHLQNQCSVYLSHRRRTFGMPIATGMDSQALTFVPVLVSLEHFCVFLPQPQQYVRKPAPQSVALQLPHCNCCIAIIAMQLLHCNCCIAIAALQLN